MPSADASSALMVEASTPRKRMVSVPSSPPPPPLPPTTGGRDGDGGDGDGGDGDLDGDPPAAVPSDPFSPPAPPPAAVVVAAGITLTPAGAGDGTRGGDAPRLAAGGAAPSTACGGVGGGTRGGDATPTPAAVVSPWLPPAALLGAGGARGGRGGKGAISPGNSRLDNAHSKNGCSRTPPLPAKVRASRAHSVGESGKPQSLAACANWRDEMAGGE